MHALSPHRCLFGSKLFLEYDVSCLFVVVVVVLAKHDVTGTCQYVVWLGLVGTLTNEVAVA